MAWQYGKIVALWTNYENVNAWVRIEDLGWRKLTNPDDDVTTAMLVACTHAKSDNRYVSFYEASAGGYTEITELYVW